MKERRQILHIALNLVVWLLISTPDVAWSTQPLTFTIEASGSVSRVLELVGGGQHRIELTVSASLKLTPQSVTCASGRFTSELGDLSGSVDIQGSAVAQLGDLNTYVLNIEKVTQRIEEPGRKISSRFTPGSPPSLYLITRYPVYVRWDEIEVYAFEYVSELCILRVWIALSVPFAYESQYEHYDFPATLRPGKEDELDFPSEPLWSSWTRCIGTPITTQAGERLEMWWNGQHHAYELRYYRAAGDPAWVIGRCWFNEGCNIVKYMTAGSYGVDGEVVPSVVPDRFVWIQHRNYDYGTPDCKDSGLSEHVVMIEHTYYPCEDALRIQRHIAKYPEGCTVPVSENPDFCKLKPACPNSGFQWIDASLLLEPTPLGRATEEFFAEPEKTLANCICLTTQPNSGDIGAYSLLSAGHSVRDAGHDTVGIPWMGSPLSAFSDDVCGGSIVRMDGGARVAQVQSVSQRGTAELGSSKAKAVDFVGFAFLAKHWLGDCQTSCRCRGVDIDVSGTIDAADLVVFAQHWLMEWEDASSDTEAAQ